MKLDAWQDGSVAEQYRIAAVPTLILFRAGQEVVRLVGLQTKAALRQMLRGQ